MAKKIRTVDELLEEALEFQEYREYTAMNTEAFGTAKHFLSVLPKRLLSSSARSISCRSLLIAALKQL